jgi:DNA polymerase-3 subunit beta
MLATMISRTIFAISAEESRFTLNGALLLFREGGLVMVSTDGHRLAMVESGSPVPGISSNYRALLPKKAMIELLKLAGEAGEDGLIQFSGDENHLFFQLGDRLLISRKLTGNFPDFERVLPKEQPNQIVLRREELKAAIERVAQFSDERSRAIRVQMAPGEVKIHSSLSETGESEESVGAEYGGPSVEIGFNAQYLLDFLRAVTVESVAFHFRDGQSAGEMRPATADEAYRYRYVIMPMRI